MTACARGKQALTCCNNRGEAAPASRFPRRTAESAGAALLCALQSQPTPCPCYPPYHAAPASAAAANLRCAAAPCRRTTPRPPRSSRRCSGRTTRCATPRSARPTTSWGTRGMSAWSRAAGPAPAGRSAAGASGRPGARQTRAPCSCCAWALERLPALLRFGRERASLAPAGGAAPAGVYLYVQAVDP